MVDLRKEIHCRSVTLENLDHFVIYEDITKKTKLERQLQQAQKFEAMILLVGAEGLVRLGRI